MNSNDYIIILSLFNLGFFGGFSHCIGMCGPFVFSQISNRLEKTSLEQFGSFNRLKHLALIPYHLGRITTYSAIAFISNLMIGSIANNNQFKILAAILLTFAALFFLNIAVDGKIKNLLNFWLPFRLQTNKNSGAFWCISLKSFSKKIKDHISILLSRLFTNPTGLKGYLLGVMLGFIPCGLLYGAIALATTIKSPLLAGIGMLVFGIGTIPSLFALAIGGYGILKMKYLNLKLISKIIILINSLTLLMMAIGLINSII